MGPVELSPTPATTARTATPRRILGTLIAGCATVCLAQISLAMPATLDGLFQADLRPAHLDLRRLPATHRGTRAHLRRTGRPVRPQTATGRRRGAARHRSTGRGDLARRPPAVGRTGAGRLGRRRAVPVLARGDRDNHHRRTIPRQRPRPHGRPACPRAASRPGTRRHHRHRWLMATPV